MGAIDQQTALHGFADERRAFDGEFDADDQAFAADLADEFELGGEFGEALAQLRAADADILKQLFILDDLEEFEGHGTSQRTAAKCGAMQSGRDARADFLPGGNSAHPNSGSERLCSPHNTRL